MADRTVKVVLTAQVQGYLDELDKASKATRETGSEAEKLAQKREAFDMLGRSMLVVGGAMAAVGLAAVKTGVEYNSMQQSSRAALKTMLGSTEAVNEQMNKLDEFAKSSPFSKSTFIQAQQQMLAFGIETKKVIPYLDAVQNAVAAAGGSNEDISGIVATMSKIQSSSKITATDLMEFGNRGVDAAGMIGSQMGKTGAQIREDITSGALSAEDALDALAAGMSEKFEGAADNVKDTFAGAMDRVKAAWRDFSAELATPLVDPEGGGALVEFLNGLADAMRGFEKLNEPTKDAAIAIAGAGTAALLAGGTFITMAPKVIEYRNAVEMLGPSAQRAAGALGAVGKAVGIAAAVFAAAAAADSIANWAAESTGAAKSADHFAASLDRLGASAAVATDSLSGGGWGNSLRDETMVAQSHLDQLMTGMGNTTADLQNSMIGGVISFTSTISSLGLTTGKELGQAKENVGELDKAMAALVSGGQADVAAEQFAQFAEMTDGSKESLARLKELFPEYVKAQKSGADASADGADAIDEVAAAADQAAGDLDEMKKALDGVAGSSMSMSEAQDAALSAINNLTKAAEAEGASLYGADDASIKLRDSMRDVEYSSRDSATAILENKGSMEQAMGSWQAGRDQIINMRVAMGESREAAVLWADQNLGSAADVSLAMSGVKTAVDNIPSGKNINITTSGDALAKIQEINNWLASTPDTKHISISGTGGISGLANGGVFSGGVKAFANSGFEPGIYPYTPGGIHKFAEEYGEGYVSLDPARRTRSVGVWQELGNRLGIGGGDSGPRVTNHFSITAAPGMDEEGLANRVIKKLEGLL